MQSKNQIFGKIGEVTAVNFLKKNKYKILATNYRTPKGEIDIIATKMSILCFIEVKTRRTNIYLPQFAVNNQKKRHIIDSSSYFLREYNLFDVNIRYDIIEVVGETPQTLVVNHIEDCFH